MSAPISRREYAKNLIDPAIRLALDSLGHEPRRAFDHLLRVVRSRSELLRPSRHSGRIDPEFVDSIVRGLVALSGHLKGWRRPVEAWEPDGLAPIPLFSSLAHHLLADYPVPPVLLSAWFLGAGRSARRRRRWFLHAGRGGSLRTAGFPIELNRRAAHAFAHAPAHFPISFALRWSQVRGLGGTDGLARAVAATRLGRGFGDEEFWASVVAFLVRQPSIDPAQVGPVVEFLHLRRSVQLRPIAGERAGARPDATPHDLSLEGLSVASLLRQAEEWKARRQDEAKQSRKGRPKRVLVRWGRSDIGEFSDRDDQGRAWTIRELLDSEELAAEGWAMSHCVASYAGRCAGGTSTIWSVGIEWAAGRQRVATVEVAPASRDIVQARARKNRAPDASCLAILERWAAQESLKPGS